MWTRKELKDRAKIVMKRSYWKMFLVSLVAVILMGLFSKGDGEFHVTQNYQIFHEYQNSFQDVSGGALSFVLGGLNLTVPYRMITDFSIIGFVAILFAMLSICYSIFIKNPIEFGEKRFFLENSDHENTDFMTLFSAFKYGYYNIVKILFIRDIKIFLWSLLLFFPGIYKSYQYRMIPYILAEDPEMSTQEVFDRTKQLTREQKLDMFVLDLSFLGWTLLGSLLFGIGIFFVYPYTKATYAQLYLCLRDQQYENSFYG